MYPKHHDDRQTNSEPSFSTSNEAKYLRLLADNKTTIVVHLNGGEEFRGYIEYYDKRFIRLTRRGQPNLFIFKHDIKYLYEESNLPERQTA